ncbi:MAG: hypothetical protein ACO1QR_14265, partial [Chthoniobacteraceae bacterium]
MAGPALDRELSAAARTRFDVATEADDAAIRRLLRENAMEGAVSLTLEREPDNFRGVGLAGGEDQTIVAFTGERLACMGRCSQRDCWLDGRATRVGYLAELRLDSHARGQFRILRDGYKFFHELQQDAPAEFYFTSIGAENERARRLLERGVRGMPSYIFLAELETLLVTVPRRPRRARLQLETATDQDIPDIVRLQNLHGSRFQLAAVWTDETIRALQHHGLPIHRFRVLREGGELVACGALWDQRGFRQIVIQRYAFPLSLARCPLDLASRILGTPRLPRPGAALPHAFLSPLAFAPGAEAMLPDFLEAFFPLAAQAGIEYLT